MAKTKFTPTPELTELLKASGSKNRAESITATHELAQALQTPLREGVLSGAILDNIYQVVPLEGHSTPEFPLHFLAPGTEKEHIAYSIPNHGYIPQRHVEGDYVMVPTYDIGSSIDWNLKYARYARWDIMAPAMQVLEAGFTKKINDDGWQTILTAAADRNIVVLDSDAQTGQFTKRLVSLMKVIMRRNGGGNSTSVNRGQLTDLYMSPEAMEDIRNWNVDQVDEVTRRQILVAAGDSAMNSIFGVNLHVLDELGEGQEYQLFYDDELNGSLPGGDVELVIGLDLRKNDSFVMPVTEKLEIFVDDNLHRMKRAGLYGWQSHGFAVLDNRRVILGSL